MAAPIDYNVCWGRLVAAIRESASQQAKNAATVKDDYLVRRAQGAFTQCGHILALMEQIVAEERGMLHPREAEDDPSLQ